MFGQNPRCAFEHAHVNAHRLVCIKILLAQIYLHVHLTNVPLYHIVYTYSIIPPLRRTKLTPCAFSPSLPLPHTHAHYLLHSIFPPSLSLHLCMYIYINIFVCVLHLRSSLFVPTASPFLYLFLHLFLLHTYNYIHKLCFLHFLSLSLPSIFIY